MLSKSQIIEKIYNETGLYINSENETDIITNLTIYYLPTTDILRTYLERYRNDNYYINNNMKCSVNILLQLDKNNTLINKLNEDIFTYIEPFIEHVTIRMVQSYKRDLIIYCKKLFTFYSLFVGTK